jgi:hypothetical protein
MNSWVSVVAGIVGVLLIAEFWLHYFVLFSYGVGYPLGLEGMGFAMAAAFLCGLVAAYRNPWWVVGSVAAAASFVFLVAHIH